MCYYVEVRFEGKKFKVKFRTKDEVDEFRERGTINGFELGRIPVVYNDTPNVLDVGKWGLIPFWAKDDSGARKTLNARIETITKLPSFKGSANNRCLVTVSAFFEWKWLDDKGKQKVKHRIHTPDNAIFALAGIWAEDKKGTRTVSIVTTDANELMATIHNSAKRMPVVLLESEYDHWLQGGSFDDFRDRSSVHLIAEPVEPTITKTLF